MPYLLRWHSACLCSKTSDKISCDGRLSSWQCYYSIKGVGCQGVMGKYIIYNVARGLRRKNCILYMKSKFRPLRGKAAGQKHYI